MTERFSTFETPDGWHWQQAGDVPHGPYADRAAAQDAAIEHLLAQARAEHGARLAALYHALEGITA